MVEKNSLSHEINTTSGVHLQGFSYLAERQGSPTSRWIRWCAERSALISSAAEPRRFSTEGSRSTFWCFSFAFLAHWFRIPVSTVTHVQQRKLLMLLYFVRTWRRDRDSNPGGPFDPTRFRVERFRPTQPSLRGSNSSHKYP